MAKGASESASHRDLAFSGHAPTPGFASAAKSAVLLSGGARPDVWAAAAWTSELHAELRASVRIRRTQALVASAIAVAAGGGGCGDMGTGLAGGGVAARSVWAAEEEGGKQAGAASRMLYIGGGGLAVTEGDVRAIVELARRGAAKALLRSVSVSRGWAFAEMVSAVEVSRGSLALSIVVPLCALVPTSPLLSCLFLSRALCPTPSHGPTTSDLICKRLAETGETHGREGLQLQSIMRDSCTQVGIERMASCFSEPASTLGCTDF
jgi:hypothetical protein